MASSRGGSAKLQAELELQNINKNVTSLRSQLTSVQTNFQNQINQIQSKLSTHEDILEEIRDFLHIFSLTYHIENATSGAQVTYPMDTLPPT
jgi:DNA repair exonuclease SbcCD ATPase subunit